MILKASQRGGAKQLARHLMNQRDNDEVRVLSMKGFVADTLEGAFDEIHAISRATRCKQFLFSVSFSPPADQAVLTQDLEDAVNLAAERIGLSDQPRVVVLHTKKGRTHAHAVFSRIDTRSMKAANLAFYKERLQELSRELYLTHGWSLPRGLQDRSLRNPANFSLEEYQVAMRSVRDPREIKLVLQQCWRSSDSLAAFKAALQEKGFMLCRGDRRGFVVIDWRQNLYSLSRWLGEKGLTIEAKLGKADALPSLSEAKLLTASAMGEKHRALDENLKVTLTKRIAPLEKKRTQLASEQRADRNILRDTQQARHEAEVVAWAGRFRTGLRGLWDWVTGRTRQLREEIEREAAAAALRDKLERDRLRAVQNARMLAIEKRMAQVKAHTEKLAKDFQIAVSSNQDLSQELEISH